MIFPKNICTFQIKKLYLQPRILTRFHTPLLSASHFDYRSHSNYGHYQHQKKLLKYASIVGIGASIAVWLTSDKLAAEAEGALGDSSINKNVIDPMQDDDEYGNSISGLPEYTASDISKHNSIETQIWISFKNGVYDITEFVKEHPGGEIIMLGAGASVEPFWAHYAIHKKTHVLQILEKYRIGNLAKADVGADTRNMNDPFANEPVRHAALRPSSLQPYNAEPFPSLLVEKLHTPNHLFYVRNHLPVPSIDAKYYELEIEGLDINESTLSVEDIKKFPKHTITAAIQCGGNRRSEMSNVKQVRGLSWGPAAISNAEWSGARLCDVLIAAGVKPNTEGLHVQFEGVDIDPTGNPYGASIPIEKALDPKGGVILAYEMNGVTLPRDHGFPIRVVVPGVVGARNVKWLGRIVISEEESTSHWQQNDYKTFAPNIDWDTVNFSKSPAIQDMPVTSAICVPGDKEVLQAKEGKFEVKGYSYSGGGRKIIRVDVSSDGGKTWKEADELISDTAKHPTAWGWTLWKTEVEVPEGDSELELVAKAVDSSCNTQPESFDNIWNLRGLLSNAYHRIHVKVKN